MTPNRTTLTATANTMPGTPTNRTTIQAGVSNANTIIIQDALGGIVAELDAGDQATDFADGVLSALFRNPTIAGTDKLYITAYQS